jgi:putative nucleotidyltransferase with HDIG domain
MLKNEDSLFDRAEFVRHSIATGIMARTITLSFNLGSANTTYVSGLLHDIGAIVICQHFREEWNSINGLIRERRLPRIEAERETLSLDHAGVGAVLLEKWALPEAIVESVRLHHSREELGENENAYVTWFANRLTKDIDFNNDLSDFTLFFEKQRELIRAEMPERYLLKHHVELFERAYENLRGTKGLLEKTTEERHD